MPVLDEEAIEAALVNCHYQLFHSTPDLSSSSHFADVVSNQIPTAQSMIDLWQQQAAEMLHLVNDQRRMALAAFSCSLDAFRVAAEDHEEFVAQQKNEREVG